MQHVGTKGGEMGRERARNKNERGRVIYSRLKNERNTAGPGSPGGCRVLGMPILLYILT